MPRKNKAVPHTPLSDPRGESGKTRYGTKRQAESAAEYQMLLKPELTLRAYRALDGGWYLTRKDNGPGA